MEHSPSCETQNFSAWQYIPHILQNPQVHYQVHNSLLLVSIPSQINSVHTLPLNLFKINFNIIFPFMLNASTQSLSFWLHTKTLCISSPPYMPHAPLILHSKICDNAKDLISRNNLRKLTIYSSQINTCCRFNIKVWNLTEPFKYRRLIYKWKGSTVKKFTYLLCSVWLTKETIIFLYNINTQVFTM